MRFWEKSQVERFRLRFWNRFRTATEPKKVQVERFRTAQNHIQLTLYL